MTTKSKGCPTTSLDQNAPQNIREKEELLSKDFLMKNKELLNKSNSIDSKLKDQWLFQTMILESQDILILVSNKKKCILRRRLP